MFASPVLGAGQRSNGVIMPLAHAWEFGGRPLGIHDGLVLPAEVKRLTGVFLSANFMCDEIARPNTYSARRRQLDIRLETTNRLAVLQPTLRMFQDFPDRSHHRIQRVQCNHVAHTDVEEGRHGLVAPW